MSIPRGHFFSTLLDPPGAGSKRTRPTANVILRRVQKDPAYSQRNSATRFKDRALPNSKARLPQGGAVIERDDEFELYDLRVEVIATERPMVCGHRAGDWLEVRGENLTLPPGQAFS